MSDYSELKRLADEAIVFAGLNGEISYAQELFIAAANPTAVLALISENERYLKLVERMVDQYVPLTELEGVPGWSRVFDLVEVVAERDRLKTEVEGLRAQHGRDSAELRSLCQARDDARKERDQLKVEVERLNEEYDKAWRHDLNDKNNVQVLAAEVEALRKDAERYRFLRQDISNNVQDFCIVKKRWSATFPDRILELDGADAEIDAAMGKGAKP